MRFRIIEVNKDGRKQYEIERWILWWWEIITIYSGDELLGDNPLSFNTIQEAEDHINKQKYSRVVVKEINMK